MSAIGVSVGRSASGGLRISVRNNGKGIPTSMHATEKIHIPELIFGHLLTGSNFNDEEVNWISTPDRPDCMNLRDRM